MTLRDHSKKGFFKSLLETQNSRTFQSKTVFLELQVPTNSAPVELPK